MYVVRVSMYLVPVSMYPVPVPMYPLRVPMYPVRLSMTGVPWAMVGSPVSRYGDRVSTGGDVFTMMPGAWGMMGIRRSVRRRRTTGCGPECGVGRCGCSAQGRLARAKLGLVCRREVWGEKFTAAGLNQDSAVWVAGVNENLATGWRNPSAGGGRAHWYVPMIDYETGVAGFYASIETEINGRGFPGIEERSSSCQGTSALRCSRRSTTPP